MSAFNANMVSSRALTIFHEGGSCRDPWSFAIASDPLYIQYPYDCGHDEPKVKVEIQGLELRQEAT